MKRFLQTILRGFGWKVGSILALAIVGGGIKWLLA